MSLGTLLDRIDADVQAKMTAQLDPRTLGITLADRYYYLPMPTELSRMMMLYLRTSLESVSDTSTDWQLVAYWVRRIVGGAIAGGMEAALIEAKYLLLFA